MESYLKPIFDIRKSFYNKAIVIESGNFKKLLSYNLEVAIFDVGENLITIPNLNYKTELTNTTLRHIKEFVY